MVYVMKAAWRFRFSAKRKVRRMERKKTTNERYSLITIELYRFLYIFIRPIIA